MIGDAYNNPTIPCTFHQQDLSRMKAVSMNNKPAVQILDIRLQHK